MVKFKGIFNQEKAQNCSGLCPNLRSIATFPGNKQDLRKPKTI
jgi:hypothetical protein